MSFTRQLAQRLLQLRGTDAVVLALPRGGVPVAFEVARELRAPRNQSVAAGLNRDGPSTSGPGRS